MVVFNVVLKDFVVLRDVEVGFLVLKLVSEGSEDLDSIVIIFSDLSEVVDVVEEDVGGVNICVRKVFGKVGIRIFRRWVLVMCLVLGMVRLIFGNVIGGL